MTKAQRRAKAKRAGAKQRKANAVVGFMKKLNPGKRQPAAWKATPLPGGGITIKPIKMNAASVHIGARVAGGKRGTQDYDKGRVLAVDGDKALVGWDSGVKTWTSVSGLRRLRRRAR